MVVEGPAGIGKTRLIADAQALGQAAGVRRVLRAVGDEPERSLPWGVVRQMAERSLLRYGGEVRERILAGPAGSGAALAGGGRGAGADEVALARTLHKLWWVAAELSAERPLLITVDDAQWADLPSLRFLAYLSRRLVETCRSRSSSGRGRSSRPTGRSPSSPTARTGDHLVPAPLSVEGVRALTGERVPRRWRRPCTPRPEATLSSPSS